MVPDAESGPNTKGFLCITLKILSLVSAVTGTMIKTRVDMAVPVAAGVYHINLEREGIHWHFLQLTLYGAPPSGFSGHIFWQ